MDSRKEQLLNTVLQICRTFDAYEKIYNNILYMSRKKYPNVPFYEEIHIKIEGRKKLFLDFYIPSFTLAIEVNGQQHYTYSGLFHKTKMDFLKAVCNDAKKGMWCEINNIDLIVLKFDEVDKWDKIIYRIYRKKRIDI